MKQLCYFIMVITVLAGLICCATETESSGGSSPAKPVSTTSTTVYSISHVEFDSLSYILTADTDASDDKVFTMTVNNKSVTAKANKGRLSADLSKCWTNANKGGRQVKVNVTKYMNTMTDFSGKDDVFTYLIHLGYLAYDPETKECRIPNNEIRQEWVNSIEDSSDYTYIMKMINASEELLEATLECDEAQIAAALDNAHSIVMNNMTYNKESCFQSAIVLAYFYARSKYTVITELPTGKGYADVAFIPFVPNVPAIVIELKNSAKATAETALDQIKSQKYFAALDNYAGDILLVGVSYNPESKEHRCRVEKMNI